MSIRISVRLAAILLAFGLGACASGADRGTRTEAQALVAKAIALYDEEGTAAFEDINRKDGGFRDRDLYVFVIGPDNHVVAHPDPAQIGTDTATRQDSDGKPFGAEMIAAATPEGAWVDYRWPNPQTGADESKSSWVVKHDGHIFGCGIYEP